MIPSKSLREKCILVIAHENACSKFMMKKTMGKMTALIVNK